MGSWNFFDPPQLQPWLRWLPEWAVKKQDQRFLEALLEHHGVDAPYLDRQVRFVLLYERWKRAVEPYGRIFKLAWEVTLGRYWKSATQVHGGTHQAPGGAYGGAFVGTASFSSGATRAAPPFPGPANTTFEDAGIRAGEVTAYRCWELRDGLLYSMYRDEFCWNPGETVEGKPELYGEGVHGFKDRLAMGSYGYNPHSRYPVVSGTVDLWGDVYEHERGYRASKAAIASIDDSPHYDAKALRKLYGLTKRKRSAKKPARRPKNNP